LKLADTMQFTVSGGAAAATHIKVAESVGGGVTIAETTASVDAFWSVPVSP
jgi:hypothetical protein